MLSSFKFVPSHVVGRVLEPVPKISKLLDSPRFSGKIESNLNGGFVNEPPISGCVPSRPPLVTLYRAHLYELRLKEQPLMRNRIAPICLGALLLGGITGLNGADQCRVVSGVMSETIVPQSQAPNDPFGRIVGMFNGDFSGSSFAAITAFLTTPPSFSPTQSGPSKVMQVR